VKKALDRLAMVMLPRLDMEEPWPGRREAPLPQRAKYDRAAFWLSVVLVIVAVAFNAAR
jgi:hypothetical protein